MVGWFSKYSLTERALLTAFVTSALLLAGAHFFERVVGLLPCALCLDQREAHWAALGICTSGLVAALVLRAKKGAAAAVGAAALIYALSAGLAFFHTGVEYKFWPGPATCSGGAGAIITDLASIGQSLSAPVEAPACDEAAWRFLGVSMAGFNMLISAGLFALTLLAALSETRAAQSLRREAPAPVTPLAPGGLG
ncbi:MAG: disulfide bond formation protein B [Pseudomonadota bacterium]